MYATAIKKWVFVKTTIVKRQMFVLSLLQRTTDVKIATTRDKLSSRKSTFDETFKL